MKKNYSIACLLCFTVLSFGHDLNFQRSIQSSSHDFLSQVTTTTDQQHLISGSAIQSSNLQQAQGSQNNGCDFKLIKLNQNGDTVFEKYSQERTMISWLQPLRHMKADLP